MAHDRKFGRREDGQIVTAHELRSALGFKAVILNHGAILQALYLPDGRNVTLGFETCESYETDEFYHGCIIGPNANRVKGAKFQIDGQTSNLTANEGEYNLHSGQHGFNTQLWAVDRTDAGLELKHRSRDGQDGFPGVVDATLNISLMENRLRLEMRATTTKPTPVNLTWHPYWNLYGNRIDDHELTIHSDQRTELNAANPITLKNTRFDFQSTLPLGSVRLDENYVNVKNITLRKHQTTLTVTSSLPDMQVYTGDYLTKPRAGIAIEPQFRPNDINLARRSLLRPGQTYQHWIEYKFDLS